ncbi:MAG TPA: prepilin-type N-terminal cleavage/methylation domain-containing protein, partial [Thermodesulfobacteriaceae bacterium]|nr:prepilin-type N-terminal cleavage/methylation domain-containing protein [Thermodesulfobacteriaceae bacterium]
MKTPGLTISYMCHRNALVNRDNGSGFTLIELLVV